MAYSTHDEGGPLGHGPSINGLRQLKKFFGTQDQSNYPALVMLLEHGATHLTKRLAVECRGLATKAKAQNLSDVASSLTYFSMDAAKAKGALILGA